MKVNEIWNLAVQNPLLAKDWHSIKNNLTPYDVAPKSGIKIWWLGLCGHEWQATIHSRSKGIGCPYCAGKKVHKENCLQHNYPEITKEWHIEKNKGVTPDEISFGTTKFYWWICKKGHEWKTSPNNRTGNGSGCPYCAKQICTPEVSLGNLNKHLSLQWHPIKNGALIPYNVFPGSNKKVWWICEKGHEWQAVIYSRKSGRGCPRCSKRISTASKNWLNKFIITKTEKYFNIDGKKFWVDGFDESNNIIYEFLGDYWHGNPKIYDLKKINPTNNKSYELLYIQTIDKLNNFVAAGFRVIYRWESGKEDVEHTVENGKIMMDLCEKLNYEALK